MMQARVLGAERVDVADGLGLAGLVGQLAHQSLEGGQHALHLGGVDDGRVVEGAGHGRLAADGALEVDGAVQAHLLRGEVRQDDELVVELRGRARVVAERGHGVQARLAGSRERRERRGARLDLGEAGGHRLASLQAEAGGHGRDDRAGGVVVGVVDHGEAVDRVVRVRVVDVDQGPGDLDDRLRGDTREPGLGEGHLAAQEGAGDGRGRHVGAAGEGGRRRIPEVLAPGGHLGLREDAGLRRSVRGCRRHGEVGGGMLKFGDVLLYGFLTSRGEGEGILGIGYWVLGIGY